MTISTEELRKLLEAATPGPFKARRSTMDDDEWEVYPTRGGREPSIPGTQWAEIATVSSDNENRPGRAKGSALLFAAAPDLATELLAARAKLEAAEKLAEAVKIVVSSYDPDFLVAALTSWEAAQ